MLKTGEAIISQLQNNLENTAETAPHTIASIRTESRNINCAENLV